MGICENSNEPHLFSSFACSLQSLFFPLAPLRSSSAAARQPFSITSQCKKKKKLRFVEHWRYMHWAAPISLLWVAYLKMRLKSRQERSKKKKVQDLHSVAIKQKNRNMPKDCWRGHIAVLINGILLLSHIINVIFVPGCHNCQTTPTNQG